MDPKIVLEHKHVICDWHGEPFRGAWPKGYADFSIKGLDLVMMMPEMLEATQGQTERVADVLAKKPICCRLPREQLLTLYINSGVGKTRKCEKCDNTRPGTEFRSRSPVSAVHYHPHVCFECILNKGWKQGPSDRDGLLD